MTFETLFPTIPDAEKLKFLEMLLSRNEDIRAQFTAYFAPQPENNTDSGLDETQPLTSSEVLNALLEAKQDCRTQLESIDPDDLDWSSYVPESYGYEPEYEVRENMIMQSADAVVNDAIGNSKALATAGKIALAGAVLAGLYEAVCEAEFDDPYGDFEMFNEQLLDTYKECLCATLETWDEILKSDLQCILLGEVLLKRHSSNAEALRFLEKMFISTCDTLSVAIAYDKIIAENSVPPTSFPELMLHLHSLTGMKQIWLSYAEQFQSVRPGIAIQLMTHYLEKDRTRFLATAARAFANFPAAVAPWLLEKLDRESETAFYAEVMGDESRRKRDIELYRELRELLSPEEKAEFLAAIGPYQLEFKVQVLEIESLHDDILRIVRENTDSWGFDQLITPILKIFPEETFSILREKLRNTVQHKRGRDYYERIAKRLILMQTIPGKSAETRAFISEIYHHKPSLPALKDEMRKAGVAPQ